MLDVATAIGGGEYVSITLGAGQKISRLGSGAKTIRLESDTTFRIAYFNYDSDIVIERNGRKYHVDLETLLDNNMFTNSRPFTINKVTFELDQKSTDIKTPPIDNMPSQEAYYQSVEVNQNTNMHPIGVEEATIDN